ncbi:GAF domain-containing protein [Umboniibacter marinipuniceus]|uniref:GAF domain-containing protein n=1 Tax=Umboniibacter marinipuniceus TaxID=569599 RepID=A0A3M0AAK9_9GAMM|nr:GAF domain-containing protein [Umboniibacter marinipuniceus]RMA79425.1 GAF domain-containing protein [Umboniibacter marinipuniceus]
MNKSEQYQETLRRIQAVCAGETDLIALLSTICCELHQSFDYYHWTGFYRTVAPQQLKVGPYQGGHGCLDIHFDRGICGAAAKQAETQLVEDVHARADHIACASTTNSEIVVPVTNQNGQVIAVLDVDSDDPAAFDEIDQQYLEQLCQWIGELLGTREYLI